jgi:hypothetical protein
MVTIISDLVASTGEMVRSICAMVASTSDMIPSTSQVVRSVSDMHRRGDGSVGASKFRENVLPRLRWGAYLRFMDPATRHSHLGASPLDPIRGQAPRLRFDLRDSGQTTMVPNAQICAQTT